MTPLSRKTMILLTGLLVALSGGLTSCQDRDFGLSIRQIQLFDVGSCAVNTDETTFQSQSIVDLSLRNSYTIFPFIENNMLSVNDVKALDVTDGRINTTDVVLRSATIEYTTLDTLSAQLQSPLVVPLSGTVKVGGFLVIGLEVLNTALLQQLQDADEFLVIEDNGSVRPVRTSIKIIARIRVEGETLDGKVVESNEFLYPIEVCNGCLITYPSNLLETRNGQLTCPSLKLDPEGNPVVGPSASSSCVGQLGSDGAAVDCQTCQGLAVNAFARQLCQPDIGE